MHGAYHPKSDRLYLPREKRGRELISCETCTRSEGNSLGWYIENAVEPMLLEARDGKVVKTDNCLPTKNYKKKEVGEREQRWLEKRMYGQFIGECIDGIDMEKIRRWLQKSDLKPETKALIYAAQEHALRTNYIKFNINSRVITMSTLRGERRKCGSSY